MPAAPSLRTRPLGRLVVHSCTDCTTRAIREIRPDRRSTLRSLGSIEVVEEKFDSRGGVAAEDLLHQVRIAPAERRQYVAVALDPAPARLRMQPQGFRVPSAPLLTDDGHAEDHAPQREVAGGALDLHVEFASD